jgi:hypothetical protein
VRRFAAVALVLLTSAGGAQEPRAQRPRGAPAGDAPLDARADSQRARLEGELRRGFARAVRQRVGLSDEQMSRLAPMSQRHEQARRQLQNEERNTRVALRQLMQNERTADPAQVERHLHSLIDLEKRRVQMHESEMKELATIMSPIQLAKFMAIQEQIRRRLEEMRMRRRGSMDEPPPGGPPPRRPPPA